MFAFCIVLYTCSVTLKCMFVVSLVAPSYLRSNRIKRFTIRGKSGVWQGVHQGSMYVDYGVGGLEGTKDKAISYVSGLKI